MPITIAVSCQVPNPSVTHQRARWNTKDVNWQGFANAVGTAIAAYPPEPISLRDRVLRLNSTLLSAAKTHVGKSKIGRYTKPWSTPEFRAAIERRNNLRRTVTENRTEYLEASTGVRKLTEEARQTKWEEFLANLEHNPDPAQTWRTTKALSSFPASTAFSEPLVHNGRTFTTNQGKANAFMKAYAAVNRLNFSRTERSRIRQLKEVRRSPTVDEACCQPF